MEMGQLFKNKLDNITKLIISDCRYFGVPEQEIENFLKNGNPLCQEQGNDQCTFLAYDLNEYPGYSITHWQRGHCNFGYGHRDELNFRFLFQINTVQNLWSYAINETNRTKAEKFMNDSYGIFGGTDEYKKALDDFRKHFVNFNVVSNITIRDNVSDNQETTNKSKLQGDLILNKKESFAFDRRYDIDIVFCIDNSQNMINHLERVKKMIPDIIDRYANAFPLNTYGIRNYRARLIVFNDYLVSAEGALQVTDFFDLNSQKELFLKVLESVKIQYGAVKSVCGFEALTCAAFSEWSEYLKNRKYIWVFSNSEASDIDSPEGIPFRKKGMPKSVDEFKKQWDYVKGYYGIWLMAPDEKNWRIVSSEGIYCLHYPSAAGEGLTDDKSDYDFCFGDAVIGFD